MTSYTEFIDITGLHASSAPLVKGGLRAYYATGTDGIEETAAQIAAAKAAGMGVVLIDQTPSLSVFAAGLADVADVETGAGTLESAAAAAKARAAHGWQSTVYISYGSLASARNALAGISGVIFWVADYSWSLATAEAFIAQNDDVVAVQYGDPQSNPSTLVPGTDVTLADCQADIDVAEDSWANQFVPDPPKPALATPSGLSETVHSFVNFGWGADPNATTYHFQILQGSKSVVDESVPTSHATASLPAGSYVWRVAADATGSYRASPWSAERTFTVDQ